MSKKNAMPSLNLRNQMFTKTESGKQVIINLLPIDFLRSFKNHPFKLYSNDRLKDMVESIKANGVLLPIIVRQIDDFTYEILSGHNRVEAAKQAGLSEIPAIIKTNITDDDALLIVTETNLLQRSFSDLSHSERAMSLSLHFEAIKKQGRRSDLISEVEVLLSAGSGITSNPMDWKSPKHNSYETIKSEYGLSQASIIRYIRVSKLITNLLRRLDDNEFSLRAAISLSYLRSEEQSILDMVLGAGKFKLEMKKAELLRELSKKGGFEEESVLNILNGYPGKKNKSSFTNIKIDNRIILQYFPSKHDKQEVQDVIENALQYYFEHFKSI